MQVSQPKSTSAMHRWCRLARPTDLPDKDSSETYLPDRTDIMYRRSSLISVTKIWRRPYKREDCSRSKKWGMRNGKWDSEEREGEKERMQRLCHACTNNNKPLCIWNSWWAKSPLGCLSGYWHTAQCRFYERGNGDACGSDVFHWPEQWYHIPISSNNETIRIPVHLPWNPYWTPIRMFESVCIMHVIAPRIQLYRPHLFMFPTISLSSYSYHTLTIWNHTDLQYC